MNFVCDSVNILWIEIYCISLVIKNVYLIRILLSGKAYLQDGKSQIQTFPAYLAVENQNFRQHLDRHD